MWAHEPRGAYAANLACCVSVFQARCIAVAVRDSVTNVALALVLAMRQACLSQNGLNQKCLSQNGLSQK